ncbi:hypothetical protein F2P81_014879 [Scophthalmus maximus]|uniref:Secreted protein n=1 Tax=Scophthalmus maximus TaxID=52904 RepID=A0A6A4SJ85_SCOMX|nr:hypothetical protein F2P81_014879 [Scophthalmus maximus]
MSPLSMSLILMICSRWLVRETCTAPKKADSARKLRRMLLHFVHVDCKRTINVPAYFRVELQQFSPRECHVAGKHLPTHLSIYPDVMQLV